jgi:hypothetical protein
MAAWITFDFVPNNSGIFVFPPFFENKSDAGNMPRAAGNGEKFIQPNEFTGE